MGFSLGSMLSSGAMCGGVRRVGVANFTLSNFPARPFTGADFLVRWMDNLVRSANCLRYVMQASFNDAKSKAGISSTAAYESK